LLCIAFSSVAAPYMAIPDPAGRPADKIVKPTDPLPNARFVRPDNRWIPRRDDIIGEAFEAGDTYYDYQSNGSIGKFIGVDQDGNVHVTWMDGYDVDSNTRHQKYNYFRSEDEEWEWEDGSQVDEGDRSGYGCLWMTEEDEQRAMVFTHAQGGPYGDDFTWVGALDFGPGWGAFLITAFPAFPDHAVLWPQGVMSAESGALHVVGNALDDDGGRIAYLPAFINDDDEIDFDVDNPSVVGQTHLNSYRIARSRVSDRVAITWMAPRTDIPAPPRWDGFLAYQMNNDLMLAYTDENGENWNFDNPVNVTQCIMPDIHRGGDMIYGDTLLPYCSHDVIFDDEDFIHIVFEARGLWWDPDEQGDPPLRRGGGAYRPGLTVDASYLFHWSEETEEFSAVADGWYWQYVIVDDTIRAHPDPGAWKSNVCYPSLAYDDNGDLYCVYNYYPLDDYNDYVDDWGRCHGDVAVTVSEDNGASWYQPTMVVQTRTHLPEPGEAESECYTTVAERVNDFLHIFYEVDTEAGTTIQNDPNAANTLCPFVYQRVPVDEILRDEIWEDGPSFHIGYRPVISEGLRDPGVPIPDAPVHVTAVIESGGEAAIRDVVLEFIIDGDEGHSVEMENVEGNTYAGTIPATEEGSNVWYRIVATDEADMVSYAPSAIWYWSYVVREPGGLTIQDVQRVPGDWGVDYSPYNGYEVTVRGVLTTPATFNLQYGAYVIQNGPGDDWAGICVRGIEADLNEGDLIEVTGTVMERDPNDRNHWEYATYIDASDYSVLGSPGMPEPLLVDVGELVWAERAEQLEGVYVEVRDFEIGSIDADALGLGYWPITDNTGDSWFTTNGLTEEVIKDRELFLDTGQGEGLVHNTWFEWIKGVFTENYGYYAIAPTGDEDVGPLEVQTDDPITPYRFALDPAYPNPFNATTKVGFGLDGNTRVRLALYDLAGRRVATLTEGEMRAGHYDFNVDASLLSAGVYVLRLEAGARVDSRKLVLMK